jgi:hypothetical protein
LKPGSWGSPLVQEEKYQEKSVMRDEIIILIIPELEDSNITLWKVGRLTKYISLLSWS